MPQPLTYAFNGHNGLVIVYANLFGPAGEIQVRLAVDTGADTTAINSIRLTSIGYELASLPKTTRLLTANGSVMASRLRIDKIKCLGHERASFSVIAHDVSSNSQIDGVLGLDFLREHTLNIDFRNGEIRLA